MFTKFRSARIIDERLPFVGIINDCLHCMDDFRVNTRQLLATFHLVDNRSLERACAQLFVVFVGGGDVRAALSEAWR